VAGTASNVSAVTSPPVSGAFTVSYGSGPGYPRSVAVSFGSAAAWGWSDNVLEYSSWIVPVANATGAGSFRNGAIVEVIGSFGPGNVFLAEDILFSFPHRKAGVVDAGWAPDNTFVLRTADDNVVFPMPGRSTAYYDSDTAPHVPSNQAMIATGEAVTARGYGVPGGIEAYWISGSLPLLR
jgi:hypothetical protein